MEAARILGTRGYIMGGYPRDIFFGKIPKDMDIFVPIPADGTGPNGNLNPEGLLRRATIVMALFGQEPDVDEFRAREGRYGTDGNFVAIKSRPQDNPQWQPIDVVFNRAFTGTNPEDFICRNFDLDVCKVYVDRNQGIKTPDNAAINAFARNYEIFDMGKALRYSVTDFAKRVKHLSEKYTGYSAMVNVSFASLPRVVQAMVDQGVLHAAREIFQEQAEAPVGDQVRLDDGAAVPRDVLRADFNRYAGYFNGTPEPQQINWNAWPFVQGQQGGVQGGAPV